MHHQEPSRLRTRLSWLPAALAGLVMGIFSARVLFEVWPARWVDFATWPGTAGVALATVLGALVLYRLGWRLDGTPGRASGFALLPFSLLLVYVLWPQVDLLVAGLALAG